MATFDLLEGRQLPADDQTRYYLRKWMGKVINEERRPITPVYAEHLVRSGIDELLSWKWKLSDEVVEKLKIDGQWKLDMGLPQYHYKSLDYFREGCRFRVRVGCNEAVLSDVQDIIFTPLIAFPKSIIPRRWLVELLGYTDDKMELGYGDLATQLLKLRKKLGDKRIGGNSRMPVFRYIQTIPGFGYMLDLRQ